MKSKNLAKSSTEIGLIAAVSVGVANATSVFTHPFHTAKVIFGQKKGQGLSDMLENEEVRIANIRIATEKKE